MSVHKGDLRIWPQTNEEHTRSNILTRNLSKYEMRHCSKHKSVMNSYQRKAYTGWNEENHNFIFIEKIFLSKMCTLPSKFMEVMLVELYIHSEQSAGSHFQISNALALRYRRWHGNFQVTKKPNPVPWIAPITLGKSKLNLVLCQWLLLCHDFFFSWTAVPTSDVER